MIFPFPYFAPKSCLTRILLLIWLCPYFPLQLVELFCCFVTSCFVYSVWSCLGIFIAFLLWLVFLVGFLGLLFWVAILFQFRPNIYLCSVFVFLLVAVVFFIGDSSQNSHRCFDFLSVVFKGTPILPHTNFATAYIKSFNTMMSIVGK